MMENLFPSNQNLEKVTIMVKRAIRESINRFNNNPAEFAKRNYTKSEKEALMNFMMKAHPCASVGKIDDCVTGEELNICNAGYEAEGYVWTDQDRYHVEHYNAAVTDDFLRLVLSQK